MDNSFLLNIVVLTNKKSEKIGCINLTTTKCHCAKISRPTAYKNNPMNRNSFL